MPAEDHLHEELHHHAPAWILPSLMVVGAVAGLSIGAIFGPRWNDPALQPLVLLVRLVGTVFLALLKGLIVPLVVTSVVTGVTRMGDLRGVGRMAGVTVIYFLATTMGAVLTGLVLVNLLSPGTRGFLEPGHLTAAQAARAEVGPLQAIYDVIVGMFPSNLVTAAADGNVLGLITFSLAFGVVLALEGKRGRALVDVFDVANEVLLRLVRAVIWLAPLGILGLVADRIGKAGGGAAVWSEVQRLAWYSGTVMAGLILHGAITLPLLIRFLGKRNPLRYAAGMGDSLLTAVGTGSSAATMPVTMRCVVSNNGVSRRAADFVIPLGTTINMNGTALYEAVAVMTIAQSYGLEISLAQQFVVLITATLAAVGAAAIPEAGLVTMVIVLGAVGLPAEGAALILSVDWILDRFRTVVNVWGDAVGACVVERYAAAPGAPPAGAPESGESETA